MMNKNINLNKWLQLALITMLFTLGMVMLCTRTAVAQDNLKRILNMEEHMALPPCDTQLIVLAECPPKLPMKPRISTPKTIQAQVPAQTIIIKDTNVVNVDVEERITLVNKIYMPQKKPVIYFSRGTLYNWTGAGLYLGGATCLIIGASRHIKHTCITIKGVVIYDNDNIREQQRIQRTWIIAGSSAIVTGFVLNWVGWHLDNVQYIATPRSVGIVKTLKYRKHE